MGTNENLIVSKALDLLNNKENFDRMSKLHIHMEMDWQQKEL